jgi:alpha-tubulin suppressor-like RCC1 family protein
LSNIVAITAGRLALKNDGTVIGWGLTNNNIVIPVGLSNIVEINGSLALKADGTAVAWGKGIHGEKFAVPAGLSNVVAVATAFHEFFALKEDGVVVEWDVSRPEETVHTTAGLSNVVSIASGAFHHLALKKDGTVFGWGENGSGEATGVATSDPPYFSSGLVTIGGQVLTNVVAIAANTTSMALKSDGKIVTWGFSPYHSMDAPAGLSNVVAIAAGDTYCLAITTNLDVAEKFRH